MSTMKGVVQMKGEIVKAEIAAIMYEKGNRVYKLKLPKNALPDRHGTVQLDLTDRPDEQQMYYNVQRVGGKAYVIVNVHKCPDLFFLKSEHKGLYYAWQPRLPRIATVCPRCKYRLDSQIFKRGMNPNRPDEEDE